MGRLLKWVGIALGGVVVVVGGAVALVVSNLDTLVNSYRADIEKLATGQLGRQVAFGPATSAFDSNGLYVQFSELKLSGATPEEPAQMSVGRVRMKVDLLKAVTSLGKDLQVQQFELSEPTIRVARNAEGRWNFQDILEHLAANAPVPEPTTEEDKPADPDRFKGLRIAGLAIVKGRLEVKDDLKLKRALVVDGFNLGVSEIIPGKDATAKLDLVIDDGSNRSPFHLEAEVRPIPVNLDFSELPMMVVRTSLVDLDLAPWGDLVPEGIMRPAAGRVSIDLQAQTNRGADQAKAVGFVQVKGLTLVQGKVSGQASDVRVDMDVEGDLKKLAFEVKRLDVAGPSLKLETRVSILEPSLAGIKNANVELRVAQLERVMGILPAGSALLPKELTLAGPFAVDVKGDPNQGNLRVDLDEAHVAWADVMDKRAGTPLNLKVSARRNGDRINLPAIALQLDTATLKGTADLSTKKGAPVVATLDTGPVILSSLKGVFPPFQKALAQKGGRVDGSVRVAADAKVTNEKQEVHARIELRGMDVKLDKTTVTGDGTLSADVTPAQGTTTAALVADLDGLDVLQLGEKNEPLVTKKKGFPAGLAVNVVHTGPTATFQRADIRLGKTLVQATGKVDRLDQSSPLLDIKVEKLDVAFDDVRAAVPAASALPAGGHLYARIAVTGDPGKLQTMDIGVDDLKLTAARNTIAGRVRVKNLDKIDLDVDIPTVDLDFDELRKLARNDAIPRGGYLKARVKASGMATKLETLVVNVDDLDTSVYQSRFKGHAHVKNLDFPEFDVRIHGDKLDINSIIAQTGGDKADAKKAKEPEKESDNPHGLSSEQRAAIRRVTGRADIQVGTVLYDVHRLDRVTALATIKKGVITFEKLSVNTYGGDIIADGTTVDAGSEWLTNDVKLKIKGLDIGRLIDTNTSHKGFVSGKVNLDTALRMRGIKGKDIAHSLEGPLELGSQSVTINGFNVMGGINDAIVKAVPFVNKLSGRAIDPRQPTSLKDLAASVQFGQRKVLFQKPARADTGYGAMTVSGNGGYEDSDAPIDLVGSLDLSPELVSQMTGGKFKPSKPVRTPLQIGGTWSRPMIKGVDIEAFLQGAGIGNLAGAVKAAAEEAHRKMEEEAAKAAAEADRLRKEAEARAEAERKRLEEEGRKALDDAKKKAEQEKKKLEDEAKKRTEEAKKKAEQEKKKLEDEAKKRADEAKKKAEDEAKKKADEAKKKAEEGLKSLFK